MFKPELYKTLSRELVISGLSRSVQVTIETMPCDSDPMDQSFESKAQAVIFERKLNDGTYFNAVVIVRASLCGESGSDILGGCIIAPDYTVEHVVADHGMIDNALAELKSNLESKRILLNKLFA